jgi:hypothetical protein
MGINEQEEEKEDASKDVMGENKADMLKQNGTDL